MATRRTRTAVYKILQALMSGQNKGPKEIAVEINRVPGTVSNNLVFMKDEGLIRQPDYGKYIITDLGREEYARLSQSPIIQSSRRKD